MAIREVNLRPLLDLDVPLVESWISAEHVRKWLIDQGRHLSDLRDRGRRSAQRIILVGDQPVGYLQAELVNPTEWAEIGLDVPEGAIDIDILIGTEEHCGMGIGSAAIKEVVEEHGTHVYVATTSISNFASRRAFEKNGFIEAGHFVESRFGRMVLMVRLR